MLPLIDWHMCAREPSTTPDSSRLQTFDQRGCVHPGCRLCASGICPLTCAHPLPKIPLRASVKMAFLVARIGATNDPCVHPFQKWPLCASVSKSLKINIWIRTSENLGFITGVLQQRLPNKNQNFYHLWWSRNGSALQYHWNTVGEPTRSYRKLIFDISPVISYAKLIMELRCFMGIT